MSRMLRKEDGGMGKLEQNKPRTQIKSKSRVRDYGEVFTPQHIVNDMCDLVPDWSGNVLEPACGDGNFLVEVARRKLDMGMSHKETASTLFGIDIQEDNVHECIARLEEMLPETRSILEKNIVCGNFLTKLTATGERIWFLDYDEGEQLCLQV